MLFMTGGAKLDCVDTRGWTPLMRASFFGRVPCVAELLQLGADVNCVGGKYGSTCLQVTVCSTVHVVRGLGAQAAARQGLAQVLAQGSQ